MLSASKPVGGEKLRVEAAHRADLAIYFIFMGGMIRPATINNCRA
jgi:hypothetical protein